jgi:hypothetical protein
MWEMSNAEWSRMMNESRTVEEAFDVVDNGFDAKAWHEKHRRHK